MSAHILTQLGTAKGGLWCDRCLLPSVVHVPVCALSEEGVYHLADFIRCTNCQDADL